MKPTVLVIDDSVTVRLQVGRALGDAGFAVLEAVDGIDALEKLASGMTVSLIVCDLNMPRMNGIDFLEFLAQQDAPRPPILMLTTDGHPAMIKRAKASGARGWMMKPFKPESLVSAARKLTTPTP